MKKRIKTKFICALAGLALLCPAHVFAQENPHAFQLLDLNKLDIGGRFKNTGFISFPTKKSPQRKLFNENTLLTYQGDFRLILDYFINEKITLNIHNETLFLKSNFNQNRTFSFFTSINESLTDKRRLMDLTFKIDESNSRILLNRFDRLNINFKTDAGDLTIGRQAISWGNGFLFNPMDVFTPFAPSQIDRDYKNGEDAVSFQSKPLGDLGNFQLLYVARTDPETDKSTPEESSIAGKYNLLFPEKETELNFIAGWHVQDTLLGSGLVTYLGPYAMRLDTTWTYLKDEGDSYASLVLNFDRGWTWWGKNFYGWVEYFYSGIGASRKNYQSALRREAVTERLERGELFTVGRHYIDTQLQIELHPLLNFYIITVNNIVDPSGFIQPYLVWDCSQNIRFHLTATLFWGAADTEYGGIKDNTQNIRNSAPDTLAAWLSIYF